MDAETGNEALDARVEHHEQEVLVGDDDLPLASDIAGAEGGRQRLQHHAQLNKVIEEDGALLGAVEASDRPEVEVD